MKMKQENNTNTINQLSVQMAVIGNKVSNIEYKVNEVAGKMEKDYVTQDQFQPVMKLVYGLVSVILLAVVGALVALVIRK